MIKELNSLINNSNDYLEIGKADDDKCIVKYAGYIQYQAGFLISQLEKEEPLRIEEYSARVARMNDILLNLQKKLNGESLPECEESTESELNSQLTRDEIQDYIYTQNGVQSS
jgi:hypothetical protein